MLESRFVVAAAVMITCLCRGDDIVDAAAKDIRVVNGKEVDLAPLHAWYRNPVGERPLKHWKKLVILEVNGLVATWPQCICKTESGDHVTLLMTAVPFRTKSVLDAMKANAETIARLSAEIDADQAAWRRQDAVALTGASGPAPYVDAAMANRAQANLNGVALTEKKEALAKVIAVQRSLQSRTDLLTVFAMFTGKEYGQFQIWSAGNVFKP